jgi:ABC-type bacteriocin/lantibiotic exporter with double-glycine peptidase domain
MRLKPLLSVSHLQQQTESDCLPVCAQMVLVYLGFDVSYIQLLKLLGTKQFGTSFWNIKRLEQLGATVTIDHLASTEIGSNLALDLPVIACLNTADLSYWSQAVDHVVVVVGIDQEQVYVNDPSLSRGQHAVPRAEFELAQLQYDNLCAVIRSSE